MSRGRKNKRCDCPKGVYCKGDERGCQPPFRCSVPALQGAKKQRFYGPFDDQDDALHFRLTCLAANREQRPHPPTPRSGVAPTPPTNRTLETCLDEYLNSLRRLISTSEWELYRARIARIKRFADEQGISYASEVTTAHLEELGSWLQRTPLWKSGDELRPYGWRTAKRIVNLLVATLSREVKQQYLNRNVAADGFTIRPLAVSPDFEPSPSETPPTRAFTFSECYAIAQQLPPRWRPALWLGQPGGLRPAEIFGLTIEDFDPEAGTLTIRAQGGKYYSDWQADPTTGKATIQPRQTSRKLRAKTRAGNRTLPLPALLVEYLNDYIKTFHGPNPDRTARLIVGSDAVTGERKNPTTSGWVSAYAKARNRAGLGPGGAVEFNSTPKHLRQGTASILRAQGLPGKAVSDYLGHETDDRSDGAAAVTAEVYTLSTQGSLDLLATRLDALLAEELGTLHVNDREDLLTTIEAAAALGCTRSNVYVLVRKGQLRPVHNPLDRSATRYWFTPEDVADLATQRSTRSQAAAVTGD